MRRGRIATAIVASVCLGHSFVLASDSTTFEKSRKFFSASNKLAGGRETAYERAFVATARYLASLRDAYGFQSDVDFAAVESVEIAGHFCFTHAQTYRSIAVLGAASKICFNPLGDIEETGATLCKSDCLSHSTATPLTDADVVAIAVQEMQKVLGDRLGNIVDVSKAEAIWVEDPQSTDKRGITLAYAVEMGTENPKGRYRAYIHGASRKLMTYEKRIWEITGYGNAYLIDPNTSKGVTPVELTNLIRFERLESPTHSIVNEDGPNVSKSDGKYYFTEIDAQLDEVQAYYALDLAVSGLKKLGYNPFGLIPVVVHYGDRYDNAFYDGQMIALGDGNGTILDLARDNSVTIHEYGHAVVDHLAHIKMMWDIGDGGAIHEGYGDYFACALLNVPFLGRGVFTDGSPLRKCNTDLAYSTHENPDPHEAGKVWSGALWEFREQMGRPRGDGAGVADRIALQALGRIQSTGRMGTTLLIDTYRAVQAADRALYRGRHLKTLEDIFRRRGFLE